MIINLTGEIGNLSFETLIKAYNEVKDENIIIYINSDGGDVAYLESIVHLINKNKNITTLIGYGRVCSAAFDIFAKVKCEKEILDETVGMVHYTGVTVDFLDKTHPSGEEDKLYMGWTKISKQRGLDFYESIGCNKQELIKIKKGNDVWFLTNRLRELLKNTNGES